MAETHGEEVKKALELKKFANQIMEVTSGRMIHGENPTVGGFGRFPSRGALLEIKNRAQEMMGFAVHGADLVAGLDIPSFYEADTVFMCCEPGQDEYGLAGDQIRISNGDTVEAEQYQKLTNERFVAHSAAKHCLYKGKPFSVGALARVNNLGDRLRGRAGRLYKKYWNPRWLKNPIYNNMAQAVEIVWALEQIPPVIDNILKTDKDPKIVRPKRTDGEGVGAVEAPRGTLYHHYTVRNGRVAEANFVIPTGQNLADCERYMRRAVEGLLKQDADDDTILRQCEMIARAYDPCISCSTHFVKIEHADE